VHPSGSTGTETNKEILAFDPAPGDTSTVGTLPMPITDAAVATIGRSTYLLGGVSGATLATVTVAQLHV
jgi:hypothetical protein